MIYPPFCGIFKHGFVHKFSKKNHIKHLNYLLDITDVPVLFDVIKRSFARSLPKPEYVDVNISIQVYTSFDSYFIKKAVFLCMFAYECSPTLLGIALILSTSPMHCNCKTSSVSYNDLEVSRVTIEILSRFLGDWPLFKKKYLLVIHLHIRKNEFNINTTKNHYHLDIR